MKKILFTIKPTILVLIFCFLISGCSLVDESATDVSRFSATSIINETNISDFSSVFESVTPTQPSSSPLEPTNSPTSNHNINISISPIVSLPEETLAMEAYKEVLQNKVKIYSPDDKKNIYLNDFLSYGGAGFDAELGVTHFAILDMDGDKIPEVVLDLSFYGREESDFCEILHYSNGTVYGYLKSHRDLQLLKFDGTFVYSGGEGDYGVGKVRFTSNVFEYDRLGYIESNNIGDSYFINNKPTTENAFNTFFNEHEDKKDVIWYEFSQESIEIDSLEIWSKSVCE